LIPSTFTAAAILARWPSSAAGGDVRLHDREPAGIGLDAVLAEIGH